MNWYPPELEPLLAVVAGAFSDKGEVSAANTGLRRVLQAGQYGPTPRSVVHLFLQPSFASLAAAQPDAAGQVYSGLLTVGDVSGTTWTLTVRIWRRGAHLCLLGEHNIVELEGAQATLTALNAGYADAQFRLAQANLKLQQREREMEALSHTDALTGVGNRRALDRALRAEVSRARRTEQPLCGVMADLDFFKRINDSFGHEVGDLVLAKFGQLLREAIRPSDVVTRSGGEEFAVLLPHTTLAQALATAERLRATLEATDFPVIGHPVPASFGVAQLGVGDDGEALLRRCDAGLYRAKRGGRNRVVSAETPPD